MMFLAEQRRHVQNNLYKGKSILLSSYFAEPTSSCGYGLWSLNMDTSQEYSVYNGTYNRYVHSYRCH